MNIVKKLDLIKRVNTHHNYYHPLQIICNRTSFIENLEETLYNNNLCKTNTYMNMIIVYKNGNRLFPKKTVFFNTLVKNIDIQNLSINDKYENYKETYNFYVGNPLTYQFKLYEKCYNVEMSSFLSSDRNKIFMIRNYE